MLEEQQPYHIIPEKDFREHSFENCWCNPRINEDGVYVHNSADGREYLEDLNLLNGEVHTHLARVASWWFKDEVEDNFQHNDDCAYKWLNKRFEYLKSFKLGNDSKLAAFASYVETFLNYD